MINLITGSIVFSLIVAVLGLVLGILVGYVIRKTLAAKKVKTAERKADEILTNAKDKEKDLLLKTKEKAIEIIDSAKQEADELKKELSHRLTRFERREETFDKQLLETEKTKDELRSRIKRANDLKEEISKIKIEQMAKLEKIAGLSQEEAKKVLFDNIENRISSELAARIRKLENLSVEQVEREAKNIIATAMQRVASSYAQETTTTLVSIPSENMKGRIIGKEGRNIKTLELLCGAEIIIDENPDSILVSGFNPIRRNVCRLALEKLMRDGRIHPGRIEEAVEEAKKDLADDIRKAGEEAAYQVSVIGLDPKLIQILGRLKYRTSYGQNVLQHSIEVAIISKLLGQELGADLSVVVKGGLLHDIGKAVDHEIQGAHPQIGYEILKKFGLPEEVCSMAVAHHEDNPQTLEGIINKVADAISGSRPGARKDSYEDYVQRLGELEDVARKFQGVEKSYAIYAGREVRVFVQPKMIDDLGCLKLARDIASKIEEELKYPGEIKVNVIRETRVEEYAR